ncbi:MAG: UDP-N-acetylmuramate dehydrogenase [Parcubacteria group bacterium Greene0714_36]|nr:MAG: UDP-N-acetylmuramate dehydrogenase [Parcubacteria group bacterium Greene0714_36]
MIAIKEDVILAPYTIYKIGGAARYFVEVKNAEELREALAYAVEKSVLFFILGAGSNVLVSDKGFDGMVIHITGGSVLVEGERLVVDAGVMMARAAGEAVRAGLTGFEWGIGVPGTIGGSVRGNAGCFGGEMKDVVESVEVFNALSLKPFTLNPSQCGFAYRHSVFKLHPEWIVLAATLQLQNGDPAVVQERIRKITKERLEKQAIGTKSCGCIFKNISWEDAGVEREDLVARFPELTPFRDRPNIPASFLIDTAGMKGARAGDAVISLKHANFFLNEGNATAGDVIRLVADAKDAVMKKYGLALKEEIQYIGF